MATLKRKANTQSEIKPPAKKRSKSTLNDDEAQSRFRKGLFDAPTLSSYTESYAGSGPYKHGVISPLVEDELLRRVRDEIRANVSFTPKETDIYRIHQSGDLANLDGLDDGALARLPSLLALRDALYSQRFREYVSQVTGCGPLSGRKTDMAINVYTPGCYLLCHDDVIGSRRVSYILYLTDPDKPWKAEWGGALRLFPVEEFTKDGEGPGGGDEVKPDSDGIKKDVARVPTAEPSLVIPPAWNQLSFFAVQPGLSFHDVEEVYHPEPAGVEAKNGGEASSAESDSKDATEPRVRMAISGWFHIPQPGEDGFVQGEEALLARNSSLAQLQGDPDQYDLPRARPVPIAAAAEGPGDSSGGDFDADELDFLLRYLAPHYLTPDALGGVADYFRDNFTIALPDVLGAKFAARLRTWVEAEEAKKEHPGEPWQTSRPPHKHRFLYMHPPLPPPEEEEEEEEAGEKQQPQSPLDELLTVLLPSAAFAHWLRVATGGTCVARNIDAVARRFRKGSDYTLATNHEGKAQLEINLGFTPTKGWEADVDEEDDEEEGGEGEDEGGDEDGEEEKGGEEDEEHAGKGKSVNGNGEPATKTDGKTKQNGKEAAPTNGSTPAKEVAPPPAEPIDVGGHEVYMAGDEDGEEDAAVYRSGAALADDDDNILFFQAPAWNRLTLVLRDSGALRFVKYVGRAAPGDRWDVSAVYDIEERDDEDEDETDIEAGRGGPNDAPVMPQWDDSQVLLEDTEEDEFSGFTDSDDSDSD